MEAFRELFKRDHAHQMIAVILLILYIVTGVNTPDVVAGLVENLFGKIAIVVAVLYMFLHCNPIVAVLSAYAAFELMRRSAEVIALRDYSPSEGKKFGQLTAFNQFPYTLEQEVVAKMAPLVRSDMPLRPASYKPMIEDTHDASSRI